MANNGNVGSITNKRDANRTQTFTYDALNRLATAQSQATSGTHCWGLEYGYDIWANLLSATVTKCSAPALSLTVGTTNRITTSGYAYDAAGNMTTVAGISGSLVYNAENQLTSAAGVTHTYDGDGRRVQKSNGTLYWYGPGGKVLQETNLTGTLLDEYVFFNGSRTARRRQSDGAVFYFFSDHLGSARVVTNATGGIVEESDYYPFGGERIITDTLNNQYKFTGQERDGESGLDYFVARHYSSTIGRFIQPDEFAGGPVDAFSSNDPLPPGPLPYADITNPQSLNKYAYTYNNPLRYTDPDGHNPLAVAAVACALNPVCVTAGVAVVTTVYVYATPQGQQLRNDFGQLVQRGVEALSTMLFAKDAEAGQLQDAADKAAQAAGDAVAKLGQAEVGRQLTGGQQADASKRPAEIKQGLDKLQQEKENLANAKGGKAIEAAKKALEAATQEVKKHAKAIEQLVDRIKKQPVNQ